MDILIAPKLRNRNLKIDLETLQTEVIARAPDSPDRGFSTLGDGWILPLRTIWSTCSRCGQAPAHGRKRGSRAREAGVPPPAEPQSARAGVHRGGLSRRRRRDEGPRGHVHAQHIACSCAEAISASVDRLPANVRWKRSSSQGSSPRMLLTKPPYIQNKSTVTTSRLPHPTNCRQTSTKLPLHIQH
jgi:hypothetical protein